jgi:glutamine amidotransferase
MHRVALIDYGAGNLTSVRKGLDATGAEIFTPGRPSDLADAAAVVVPGVGHFAATASLSDEWRRAIMGAIGRGTPLLGICLGLQWLFESSEEAPGIAGLGTIPGRCERLPAAIVKVPHVGWNALEILRPSTLLDGLTDRTQVYFTHAYAAPVVEETTASTTHGARFSAVVERGHIFGVQFHPEKSGEAGIRVLRNFIRLGGTGGGGGNHALQAHHRLP